MYSHNFVSESETIIWMPTAEFIFLMSLFSAIILFCIVAVIVILWKNKKAKETTKRDIKTKKIQTAPLVKNKYNIPRTPD